MRTIVIHRAGGYQRLALASVPDPPAPTEGEVEIVVDACGVNFADCIVRMGLYASAREYVGWPITPGFEVAGRIGRVGPGVVGFMPGDAVLAVTRFGGYATRLVAPVSQVFPLPAVWSMAQAASFPSVHLTAWWALFELAHPRPGATLLVHSAAGGVGQALCALARIAGARVVGVVGHADKIEAARRAGADAVEVGGAGLVERLHAHAPRGYDVVLDATGYQTLRLSWDLLAPGGKLVVYGFHSMFRRGSGRPSWPRLAWGWLRTPRFDPLRMTGDNKSVLAFNLSYLFDRTDLLTIAMTQLLGWVAEGRLSPPEVRTYPFDRVADAHRALETGRTTGKLALTT